jgi:hypothetical protein
MGSVAARAGPRPYQSSLTVGSASESYILSSEGRYDVPWILQTFCAISLTYEIFRCNVFREFVYVDFIH